MVGESADEYRWQGAVDAKLDGIAARIDQIASAKDRDHAGLHTRIDDIGGRVDKLESKWDRLLGAAIGIGIGAGAVGGGVGALVSNLIAG